MEQIYKATIYQFESKEKTDMSIRYIIDDKTMKNVIGILDENTIVDIETGVRYPILKREETSIRLSEEIELGKFYAGRVESLEINYIDSDSLRIYLKAFQMRRLVKAEKKIGKVKVKK